MVRKKFVLGLAAVLVMLAALVYLDAKYREMDALRRIASEAMLLTGQARMDIAEFHRRHGRLPKDAAEAGIKFGSLIHLHEARYAAGEVSVRIRQFSPHSGKAIRLKADLTSGGIKWRCFGDDLPLNAFPENCRPE